MCALCDTHFREVINTFNVDCMLKITCSITGQYITIFTMAPLKIKGKYF